jgi:LemA protein
MANSHKPTKMKKTWAVVLIIAGIIVIYAWSSYNGLVSASESVDQLWAQVETQYQRRFDLIPNLVSSVRGAMQQEQKVFGDLAEARTRYAGAASISEKVAAANQVESALARLLVVMENYPQLKSIEAAQTLMVQLEGTENRISVERKRFNEEVQVYNLKVKRFPGKIMAAVFGFEEKEYFQSTEGAENAPQVNF